MPRDDNKMASDVEELGDFLESGSLNTLFNQIQRSSSIHDLICIEHYKNKLENYISIVVTMSVAVNKTNQRETVQTEDTQRTQEASLSTLLNDLLAGMEQELGKLSEVEICPTEERREITSLLPSTGGRPFYEITKDQIEQLRETGMNWRSIAEKNIAQKKSTVWDRGRLYWNI